MLRLSRMAHEDGKTALINAVKAEMKALKNTRALIIDVRNNGGGWGEIGDTIVGHLVDHKVRRYQAQLKNSNQALVERPNLAEILGGGTGYPLRIELPWGYGHFRLSILRGYSNHGRFIEGTGTIPDVEIHDTLVNIAREIDGKLLDSYRFVLNELNDNQLNSSFISTPGLLAEFSSGNEEIVPYTVEEIDRLKLQDMD